MVATVEQASDDRKRQQLVQTARRFKRSWVEMAESLADVQKRRLYRRWGYEDLHSYCAQELHIKKATVDKLLLSFGTLTRHAPEVLGWDGVAQPLPSWDAVDYFARALDPKPSHDRQRGAPPTPPPRQVIDELKQAVFHESQPIAALRRRFNPILNPPEEGVEQQQCLQQTLAATRRLAKLLPEVEGLSARRKNEALEVLETLAEELDKIKARSA